MYLVGTMIEKRFHLIARFLPPVAADLVSECWYVFGVRASFDRYSPRYMKVRLIGTADSCDAAAAAIYDYFHVAR